MKTVVLEACFPQSAVTRSCYRLECAMHGHVWSACPTQSALLSGLSGNPSARQWAQQSLSSFLLVWGVSPRLKAHRTLGNRSHSHLGLFLNNPFCMYSCPEFYSGKLKPDKVLKPYSGENSPFATDSPNPLPIHWEFQVQTARSKWDTICPLLDVEHE